MVVVGGVINLIIRLYKYDTSLSIISNYLEEENEQQENKKKKNNKKRRRKKKKYEQPPPTHNDDDGRVSHSSFHSLHQPTKHKPI